MKLSPQGDKLIEQREGVRLYVYLDSAGKKTAGMGHLLPPTSLLKVGNAITQAQCDAWAQADIQTAVDAVNRLVKVALTQNQFDALCSFVFNVGVAAFTTSTLLKLLNAGDYTGAQAEFARWHFKTVNGQKVPDKGLLNRRLAEAAQFGAVQTITSMASPQVSPPAAPDPAPSRPAAPPSKVTQTTTGKLQIGALATGVGGAVIQGINHAMPVINSVQSASSTISGMPHWLMYASAALAVACIGFCGFTLLHKHRSL